MSNYQMPTKHPITHKWEIADWIDDYFGGHKYGVKFSNDKKVYRSDHYTWETKDTLEAYTYISNAEYKEPKYNWFQKLMRCLFKMR